MTEQSKSVKPKVDNQFGFKGEIFLFLPAEEEKAVKELKTKLSALERKVAIEKRKDKPDSEAIKKDEEEILKLKYKNGKDGEKLPSYDTLQKHLLTISKPVDKKVAKVELGEAGMEIEKSVFVKKFELDTEGMGAKMIPEKTIIERFEVNFETGDAAVSVATEPGKDFILNRYGDLIYLQSAQVVYIRKASKVTD